MPIRHRLLFFTQATVDMNYYNENDPKAAAWLRELINKKLIPNGDVDERSIVEVKAHEIKKYIQHHFFAGIGGWAYALKLASWPKDEPVVTMSCPCQPFSVSGKGHAEKDSRHLWPVGRELIRELQVPITFGEQVTGTLGRKWLTGVRTDLEQMGHRFGAADLCSAGVSAPNIRQRFYWVAYAKDYRFTREQGARAGRAGVAHGLAVNGLVQSNRTGRNAREQTSAATGHGSSIEPTGGIDRMGDTDSSGPQGRDERIFECPYEWPPGTPNLVVLCTDGKYRRFEPGAFPLSPGISGRVGLLRGYGNAINPWLAAEFIQASIEAIHSEEKIMFQPEF